MRGKGRRCDVLYLWELMADREIKADVFESFFIVF